MTLFGRLTVATSFAGALLLAGCGGGSSSTMHNQQAGQGIAVGEPNPAALSIAAFQDMARSATCTETRNRLYVIDGKQVLWDHAGNCADASYEQVLFGADPQTPLCRHGDTIAGPRTSCTSDASRAMFDTIVQNLDKADLGIGASHKVEQISFLPKAGTALAYDRVAKDTFSGVNAKQTVVIKDQAAWERLWAQHTANRPQAEAAPKVDFANKMLVGVFLGETGNCHTIAITGVTAGTSTIKVAYEERALQTFDVCPAVVTAPMQVVAIDRSDIPVEFVPSSANTLNFATLDLTNQSGVHEARTVVVKDADAWQRLWAEHSPGTIVPAVDFGSKMVVAVFMGSKNPCYGTEITSISRGNGKITVTHTDREPRMGVMCIMLATSPAHLVTVERSDLPVEFAAETVQGG